MRTPPSSSTTAALPALRAALKMLPGVDRVAMSRSGTLAFLHVNVAGCRVLAAAAYPVAGVVVPLAAVPDHSPLTEAVCGAAHAHHLTILHGVRDRLYFSDRPSVLSLFLPDEAQFIREAELAVAQFIRAGGPVAPAMALKMAQAERWLVDLAGMKLRTGVALLTGAPLDLRTLDFPLVDAEVIQRRSLEGII
ncbi:hypothetical protein [Deinococcus radiopugnans]|uniref:Uncharacterized protein n=1 Tax=Deinococcus radiopugnans ATCC 19172 TaxID=585398 RepID=A0A5C4Y799_9DEIO|nr:hypothetical protein [Deinococcus radiopugnans]MBB6017781.1 hypothetical protein [Deinococcus radiopugnans ATCC 19172]TNM71420.1 hypothetical protein FHR04_07645 [Deinococcus radiopugnans ATCC 19172]